MVWRPDGSGVWVNGDDGIVRGIEAKTGKVVHLLRGHEAGTKVRSLWAGYVGQGGSGGGRGGDEREQKQEEVVVSGGFDKRVIIWRVADS